MEGTISLVDLKKDPGPSGVEIVVAEITPRCLTEAAGRRLLSAIIPHLSESAVVNLNFRGITMFASLFFNNSVAELLRTFDISFIEAHLHVSNLNGAGLRAFRSSMDNAVDYFRLAAEQRSQIDHIIDVVGGAPTNGG